MSRLFKPVLDYQNCLQFLQACEQIIYQQWKDGNIQMARDISACVNEVCNEVNKLRL